MQLLGSTKNKVTKDENGEITEVVLVHCNIVDNDYQHNLRVLYTFVSHKLFDQLTYISPKNLCF